MEPNSFTPFDNMTQTRELQMLKTAIPYMKGDQKKQFAILIKIYGITEYDPGIQPGG